MRLSKQLECRIVLTFLPSGKVKLGMYDPLNMRYEALGVHGPARRDVDRIVNDLKTSIERAGHKLTFCEVFE